MRAIHLVAVLGAASALFLSCGDDNGGSTGPVDGGAAGAGVWLADFGKTYVRKFSFSGAEMCRGDGFS
jgi:hypothetical protein